MRLYFHIANRLKSGNDSLEIKTSAKQFFCRLCLVKVDIRNISKVRSTKFI